MTPDIKVFCIDNEWFTIECQPCERHVEHVNADGPYPSKEKAVESAIERHQP